MRFVCEIDDEAGRGGGCGVAYHLNGMLISLFSKYCVSSRVVFAVFLSVIKNEGV